MLDKLRRADADLADPSLQCSNAGSGHLVRCPDRWAARDELKPDQRVDQRVKAVLQSDAGPRTGRTVFISTPTTCISTSRAAPAPRSKAPRAKCGQWRLGRPCRRAGAVRGRGENVAQHRAGRRRKAARRVRAVDGVVDRRCDVPKQLCKFDETRGPDRGDGGSRRSPGASTFQRRAPRPPNMP
jgi:hypothetical protein